MSRPAIACACLLVPPWVVTIPMMLILNGNLGLYFLIWTCSTVIWVAGSLTLLVRLLGDDLAIKACPTCGGPHGTHPTEGRHG